MKLRNKIISSVLSGVLVVSMVPFSAFAEQGDSDNINIENMVAAAGDNAEKKDEAKKDDAKKDEKKDSSKTEVIGKAARDKISSIIGIPLTPDKLLEKIAETGVELFFKHVVDVSLGTDFGSQEDKQTKILRIVQEMKEQVDKIEKTTDQTYIRVKQAALETPLNNFLKDLSQVKNSCNDLTDLYKKAISIKDKNQRDEAIATFKKDNLNRLRDLATKLNTLFDSATVVVQGRGTQDVISVYDQLMAESYNFANGVPYEQRMQFRNSLASTWIYGALIASVLGQGSDGDSYKTQMNAIYVNGKKLNKLVNKTRKLEEKQVEKIEQDGTRSVYSYTLGKFVRLVDGNWSFGWKKVLRRDRETRGVKKMPEGIGTYCDDEVKSPFGCAWKINFASETAKNPFGNWYVNTDQLKAIYNKIPKGKTLVDELVAHKLGTNKEGKQLYDLEKYVKKGMMVGGEKFIHHHVGNTHIFMMDTYPTNGGQGTAVTKDNEVFKATLQTHSATYDVSQWYVSEQKKVDPALLFALQFSKTPI